MERKLLEDDARLLVSEIVVENNVAKLMELLHNYDEVTFNHCMNVGFITAQACMIMDLSDYQVLETTKGALLHDIGKIMVPKKILQKRSGLLMDEYAEIKKHPDYGLIMVQNQNFSSIVKDCIYMHHEKNDGTGYPHGLRKSQIPVHAKIIGVVDAYDAMTSVRPYKKPYDGTYTLASLAEMHCYGHRIVSIIDSVIAR